MMKTKFKSKVLLLVVILLMITCIFKLNIVNATDVIDPDNTAITNPTEDGTETTPPASDGTETTPPTSDGTETTPPASDGTETTPPTSDGTETTPPASDGTETTPPASDGTETTPPASDGTETPPPASDGNQTEEMPKPITDPTEILKLIPDTIALDILESEIFSAEDGIYGVDILLNEQIRAILESNNIDLDNLGMRYWNDLFSSIYSGEIKKCKVEICRKNTYEILAEKEINIKYKNSDNYNTTDEQYVKNKLKDIDFSLFISEEIGDEFFDDVFEQVEQHVKKLINDESLTYSINIMIGGGADFITEIYNVFVFKNGVLYDVKTMEVVIASKITIPDEISDTDEAYINYALPAIKEWWSYFTVTGVTKIEGEILTEYDDYINMDIKNDGTFYKISLDEDDWARVILKKANKTKIIDDITIGDEAGVIVNATKIDVADSIYAEMKQEAKSEGYNYVYDAYEFNLVSGEITNGLTISFDLGTANNKNEAIVIHKKSDGTYEKFVRTVENGKIEITVDELSPFMVALKYRNRKLDKEPNTGIEDYTVIASAIATISLMGLAIIKFRK